MVITTRIEYVKRRTELQTMTQRPSTIDWKRFHKLTVALEAYEIKKQKRSNKKETN